MRLSGLKFWPSYERPHCNQSPGDGSRSMAGVTGRIRPSSASGDSDIAGAASSSGLAAQDPNTTASSAQHAPRYNLPCVSISISPLFDAL
jgi:hypothetical protein